MVIANKKIFYLILSLILLSACDFITHRNLIVKYEPNLQPAANVASVIDNYFINVGFNVLEKRHTVYPRDEKKTRYWVGEEGYRIFNFTRRGEAITLYLVENNNIYLKWDQFGPKFEPAPEYFDLFIEALKKELKDKLALEVTIELMQGDF